MSPDSGLSAATKQAELLAKGLLPEPLVDVATQAASDLNDILNAVGLRVALIRGQGNLSLAEKEIERLMKLVERAALRVHRLQHYAHSLTLPRSRSLALARQGAQSEEPKERQTAPGRTRVLIIQGPTHDASYLRTRLSEGGCRVTVANSPADALRLIQSSRKFDHILCDAEIMAASKMTFASDFARTAPGARLYCVTQWGKESAREDS